MVWSSPQDGIETKNVFISSNIGENVLSQCGKVQYCGCNSTVFIRLHNIVFVMVMKRDTERKRDIDRQWERVRPKVKR